MKSAIFKTMSTISLLFILVILSFITVKANAGPPANVEITIINAQVDYSVDLLILPATLPTQEEIDEAAQKIDNKDYPFYDTLFSSEYANFQDSEGYVSNVLYGSSEFYISQVFNDDRGYLRVWMDIPREFKILIYTEDDVIITSELIIMSQFDFRLTYDLSGIDMTISQSEVGVVSGFIGNPWENLTTWVNFLLRLIMTLAIELGVLYIFGFRKKSTFIFVTGMNIISQIALNIAVIYEFYTDYIGYGFLFTYIIGELLVFLGEAILVSVFVKEHKLFRKIAYSFCANAVSLIIGLLVASSLSFLI